MVYKKYNLFFVFAILGIFLSRPAAAQNSDMADIRFSTLSLIVNDQEENVPVEEFSNWIDIRPELYLGAASRAEIENIHFCPVSGIYCDLMLTQKDRLQVGKISRFSVQETPLKTYLEDLTRRLNKDPVDAKFQIEDGKVSLFSLGEKGLKINVDESLRIISENLMSENNRDQEKKIRLAAETVEPAVKSEDVRNLGIDSLIGEGKSNFRGSPKNRVFNIRVAAGRFNGVLIKPQEEFSFVKILGEVDGEHGYLPELVIKQDKTEPEFGGGICQVSTTTFRAAIYSGLKITARRNHAYPVAYYNPQGLDATVYVPRPDLRFINNTPGYILIQTKIEGTELTFQFYGTSDGRAVEVEGPKILERNPDGSMKTTFTQIVENKDGEEMLRDVFKSNYESPSKYPHPGEEKITKKPDDWSKKQWEEYKKSGGL